MRSLALLACVLGLAGPAVAGELVYLNGNRLAGELGSGTLLVSTGTDLVEVVPDQVSTLTRDEIRLKDGRVVRGTLVGRRLRVQTALGELAVDVEELREFRAEAPAAPVAASAAAPPPAVASPPAAPPVAAAPPVPTSTPVVTSPPAPVAVTAPAPPPAVAAPPAIPPVATSPPAPTAPAAVASPPAPVAVTPPAPANQPAPKPAGSQSAPSDGPTQVADGAKQVGTSAQGVGDTVVDAFVKVGQGFKAFGEAVWEGMKSAGHALQSAFTGDD